MKTLVEIGRITTNTRGRGAGTHVLVRAGRRWLSLCNGALAFRESPAEVDVVTCKGCILEYRRVAAVAS